MKLTTNDKQSSSKETRHKILSSRFAPLVALVANLFMAYVVYFLARVVYLLENYSIWAGEKLI